MMNLNPDESADTLAWEMAKEIARVAHVRHGVELTTAEVSTAILADVGFDAEKAFATMYLMLHDEREMRRFVNSLNPAAILWSRIVWTIVIVLLSLIVLLRIL